jgi:hypothetical protein
VSRDARGQFALSPFDRARQTARRTAIIQTHAHFVTDPAQGGRVVALCREWGVPCPRFVNLPPLPEVAPGIFANTTDAAMLAALETI